MTERGILFQEQDIQGKPRPLLENEHPEEYAAELADQGLRLVLDLLIDAPGSELSELEALTEDELWGVLTAFNFLARRMEKIRAALKILAGSRQNNDLETHHCDHHHGENNL